MIKQLTKGKYYKYIRFLHRINRLQKYNIDVFIKPIIRLFIHGSTVTSAFTHYGML